MKKPIRVLGTILFEFSDISLLIDVTVDHGDTIIEPLSRALTSVLAKVTCTDVVTVRFQAPYPIEVTVYWEGQKTALDLATDINNEIYMSARIGIFRAMVASRELIELKNQKSLARFSLTQDRDWKKTSKAKCKRLREDSKLHMSRWFKWLIVAQEADPEWVGEDSAVVLE